MTQDELEVTQDVAAAGHAPGLPPWTIAAPVFGGAVLAGTLLGLGGFYVALLGIGLAVCVFASVYHAETIAHRVGEPYGTLVLALAVTLIEVALIISLMLGGGPDTATLARDTIFAAVMIILTAIVGLSLFMGGLKYREQEFGLDGTTAALVALAAIVVLTLVFPNYTETPGPYYSSSQLAFISVISLVIYGSFVFAQTVSNRPLFVTEGLSSDGAGGGDADPVHAHPPPSNTVALASPRLSASVRPTRSWASSLPRLCCFPRGSPPSPPPATIGCKRASIWPWARRSRASASRFRRSARSRFISASRSLSGSTAARPCC